MKTSTIFHTVVAIVMITGTAFAAAELTVDKASYNFGTVPQGKKVQHVYVIKNNGDALLQVKHIASSCGCTAATSSTSFVAPGKTAEIKAVFDSANFTGRIQKSIQVSTNAGKSPELTLVMEGTVVEELEAVPRMVNLGETKAGVPREVSIVVRNRGSVPRKLLNVAATSSALDIKASIRKGEIKPGETGAVDLVITARPDARVLSGYLTIATDNPQKKEISIPIYGSHAK